MSRQSIRASNRERAKANQKAIMRIWAIPKAFIAHAKRYGSDAEAMVAEFKKARFFKSSTAN